MEFEDFAESSSVASGARELSRLFADTQAEDFGRLANVYHEAAQAESMAEISDRTMDAVQRQPVALGAGVVRVHDREAPVLVVNERLVGGEGLFPSEQESLAERLLPLEELEVGRLFAERMKDPEGRAQAAALVVPEPAPYFRQGERITEGARFGTLGCRVTSREGKPSILTAGHVPTGQGAIVRASSSAKGIVTYCSDPARVPFSAAVADVAVITPPDRGTLRPGGLQVGAIAQAHAGDRLASYGAVSGPQTMECAGVIDPLYIPSMAGRWASVYMTTAGQTKPGDSGGMVLSPTGDLIGHVVGGSASFTSWIQDADYQLTQAGAQLAP